ncbi:MAG: hypothetical protein R3B96_24295 [Pirellulaceae bacterium]
MNCQWEKESRSARTRRTRDESIGNGRRLIARKAETIEGQTSGEMTGVRPIDPRNDLEFGLSAEGSRPCL